MLIVKGIYEHGQIRLTEPVPTQINEPSEVTVTFSSLEPMAAKKQSALALIGLLNTLTESQLSAFDNALQRKPFFGSREIEW
jgi:hypothetical protein